MNNTEKKLDALIDALGFDVEENMVGDHSKVGWWIEFKSVLYSLLELPTKRNM